MVSMTGSTDASTDYSDFEYQQLQFTLGAEAANGAGAVTSQAALGVSPLDDIGGLANNEVVELVAYRITVAVNPNDPAIAGDQNVGGGTYFQGAFGANADDTDVLPDEFDFLTTNVGPDNTAQTIQSASRDEIFELFQGSFSLAFDDETNGLGGGQDSVLYSEERDLRGTTGRGPVLDQTDDVTVAAKIIQNDSVQNPELVVHVHCIWDVAETSDAGRAFSVPK